MRNEEYPYLNLDRATSLYLPFEPIEARAHHRFAFRLANGDEEWLLARLCLIKPDAWNGRDECCIVLRPENAEESRIFIANNVSLRIGEFADTPYADRQNFDWNLYVESLPHDLYNPQLSRCSIVKIGQQTTLVKLHIGGGARVVGNINERDKCLLPHEGQNIRFRWRRRMIKESDTDADYNYYDLQFLRISDDEFTQIIRAQCENRRSKMRYALRWSNLDNNKRNSIAFQCKNGSWDELIGLAESVLKIRISQLNGSLVSEYKWKINYHWISVEGCPDLRCDGVLSIWRYALTNVFQTCNLYGKGLKNNRKPLALIDYMDDHNRAQIVAVQPSMHELVEAHLELEKWAKAHFSEENTRILIDSLREYSRADAHQLELSLSNCDLLDAPLKWVVIDADCYELLIGATQCLLRYHGFYRSEIDGILGKKTVAAVKAFQKDRGLKVNGIIGPQTLPYLITTIESGFKGDAVRSAQLLVGLWIKGGRKEPDRIFSDADGIFSVEMENAVLKFQSIQNRMQNLLREDGIVGPRTWCLLFAGYAAGQSWR